MDKEMGLVKFPNTLTFLPCAAPALYTRPPKTIFTEIGSALFKQLIGVKMMCTDYENNLRYYFDGTLRQETGEWSTPRNFTIDEPSAYFKNVLERESEFRL